MAKKPADFKPKLNRMVVHSSNKGYYNVVPINTVYTSVSGEFKRNIRRLHDESFEYKNYTHQQIKKVFWFIPNTDNEEYEVSKCNKRKFKMDWFK